MCHHSTIQTHRRTELQPMSHRYHTNPVNLRTIVVKYQQYKTSHSQQLTYKQTNHLPADQSLVRTYHNLQQSNKVQAIAKQTLKLPKSVNQHPLDLHMSHHLNYILHSKQVIKVTPRHSTLIQLHIQLQSPTSLYPLRNIYPEHTPALCYQRPTYIFNNLSIPKTQSTERYTTVSWRASRNPQPGPEALSHNCTLSAQPQVFTKTVKNSYHRPAKIITNTSNQTHSVHQKRTNQPPSKHINPCPELKTYAMNWLTPQRNSTSPRHQPNGSSHQNIPTKQFSKLQHQHPAAINKPSNISLTTDHPTPTMGKLTKTAGNLAPQKACLL
eukprot:gene3033-2015_t